MRDSARNLSKHAPPARRQWWKERLRLIAKAVSASVAAWLLARHAAGHEMPYFAPLAALLGVYPTVIWSLRESLAYAGGFAIAIVVSLGVSALIGPGVVGIALVIALALLAAESRWLAGQGAQIPFMTLFALLLGGEHILGYMGPRLIDVAIGLATGLAVNVLIFPPLNLRHAEYRLQELQEELAGALSELADQAEDQKAQPASWRRRETLVLRALDHARRSCAQGDDGLRLNPRARLHGLRSGQSWQGSRRLIVLEQIVVHVRSIASTLCSLDSGATKIDDSLRKDYADLLRSLASRIRQPPGATSDDSPSSPPQSTQQRLETPFTTAGAGAPGLWDPGAELMRLSGLILTALSPSDQRPPNRSSSAA
ncbi:FUSC family protein [Spirillospora sp. NPDC047279]|uniref:FUSC family protein n=1 Tax=Spirillospora sp. NPDC047279 TaxID=3155478 RepID=UPI0033E6C60D